MLIKRWRGWEMAEREATPEAVFRDRRRLIQAAGLDSVLADLTGEETLYVLDEAGDDVRGRSIDRVHPVFFVGDHLGFDPGVRARLDAEGAKAVRVGPISLHADQAIVLMQSELDRGA